MPQISHGRPMRLTPVPLNVKLAVAPAAALNTPLPPLRVAPAPALLMSDHEPAGDSVAALSSKRVVPVGGPFETVTITGEEVVRFPAASRATAVRVWEPFPVLAVFQEVEYGAEVSSA